MNKAAINTTFETLGQCVRHLGVAILAIWGVDEKGFCRCSKGTACNSPGKHPNSKLCPNGVKNATRDLSIIREWTRMAPNGNWALRCGEPLADGGFLGAFDWDPRNGAEQSIAEIRSAGCELPETVSQVSGGGGGHRLYRFLHSPASRCVAPGLDLQGGGKYIVISPSRHTSGKHYTWDLGQGPGEIKVHDAPQWMMDGTGEALGRPVIDGGSARETVLGEAFHLAGRAGPVMPDGNMYVNCPQSHLHSDARGRGEDASTIVMPPAGGSRAGSFKCQHGHCANLKWHDVAKLLPPNAMAEAHKAYPRLVLVRTHDEPSKEPPTKEKDEITLLKERLHYTATKTGYKIVSDIVNTSIILTHDPRWRGVLRYDEFGQVLRFVKDPPWHADDAGKVSSEVWSDEDTTRLDLWLRRTWAVGLKSTAIRESVYVVGRRDSMNPLQDYLNSLSWDGQKRIDTWLGEYAGVEESPYVRAVGRKWLLSAVARGFEPGCKVDTCLVLEGPQGKGKSTLLRTLVPDPKWFSDTPIDLASKDAYVALRGKWIIELAELATLKKADFDRIKAFFSSPVDSYRPPYGREQITVPRTTIFAGTVNLGEYLADATGGRRFWPIRCGAIDLDGLAVHRDQLWAEAVTVYKDWVGRGRPQSESLWWPSYEETPLMDAEQTMRQVAGTMHPWAEALAIWASTEKARTLMKKQGCLLLRDFATHAIELEDKDMDKGKMTSIGVTLTRELGWTKKRMSVHGVRTWGYYPTRTDGQ